MSEFEFSPEIKKDFLTWQEYERDVEFSVKAHKQTRGLPRSAYLRQEVKASINSYRNRYQFIETNYGHILRIVSESAPSMNSNQYLRSGLEKVDTSFFTEKPIPGVDELALKFHRAPIINGKRLVPVMQMLVNPSEDLLRRAGIVERIELDGLDSKQRKEAREVGDIELTEISMTQVIEGINSNRSGQSVEHWHPAHNINFAERAWVIVQRILRP